MLGTARTETRDDSQTARTETRGQAIPMITLNGKEPPKLCQPMRASRKR